MSGPVVDWAKGADEMQCEQFLRGNPAFGIGKALHFGRVVKPRRVQKLLVEQSRRFAASRNSRNLEEKNEKQMMGTGNLGDDAFHTGALTGWAVVEVTRNKIGPGEVNCPKPGIVVTRSYFGYRNIIPSQGRYVQNKKPETIYQSRIGTAYLAASRGSSICADCRVALRRHLATAVLPHGVPTSLSLDTYSIWHNGKARVSGAEFHKSE
jgi:hypothetical protein